jgi:hypothetical protein
VTDMKRVRVGLLRMVINFFVKHRKDMGQLVYSYLRRSGAWQVVAVASAITADASNAAE